MYEELYEKLPDRNAYLRRIGLEGLSLDGSLETLNKVLYAHVHTVPFENLDAWDRKKAPSLAIRDLFEKVVVCRRGGWCHELNALLQSLLEALGFEAYSVGGRVTAGLDFLTPIGHHAVICVIDGKKYYCDVGFGDTAFQSAVALDGTPSELGFHIEKNGDWYEVWRGGSKKARLLMFADLKFEPMDYLFANTVSATDPKEHFRSQLFMSIMRGDKRILLRDTLLTEQGGEGRSVIAQADSREALLQIMRDYFGVDYSF